MNLSRHGMGGTHDLDALLTTRVGLLDQAQRGDLVVLRAWKYSGYAHWTEPGRYLGQDEHGHWVLQPKGTFCTRPGMSLFSSGHSLVLVPHTEPWIATFHPDESRDPGHDILIYVDVSAMLRASSFRYGAEQPDGTWARCQGYEVESFDMDLDVVMSARRGIFIDDEDEFEEHAKLFGYSPELMEAMEEVAQLLKNRMEHSREPFLRRSDAVGHWLAVGADLLQHPLPPAARTSQTPSGERS